MEWYKIELSSDQVKAGKEGEIAKAFTRLYIEAGGQRDAAMFTSKMNPRGDCVVYLSPGAVRIAQALIAAYNATPCAAPSRDVILLVGHQDAGDELLA